jgi:hypothetical protein
MSATLSEQPAADVPVVTGREITQGVELLGGQRLTIVRAGARGAGAPETADVLHLVGPDGNTTLKVYIGPEGTKIELGAASLAVRVAGDLAIDAGRISLHGREGFSISTGGDLTVRSDANIFTRAVEQKFVATRGDVTLYANDDVKIDGERIRMNC